MLVIQNARLEFRLNETVNRLNIEHRTFNIEHPILMALCFIYFKADKSHKTCHLKTAEY